jgi:hypothetical protein
LAHRGAGAVNGHNHHFSRGRAVISGNRNARRRHLGGTDSNETRTDELAVVAHCVKGLGRSTAAVTKPLIVGVIIDEPPVAIGVEVMIHDAVVKLTRVIESVVNQAIPIGFFRGFRAPALDGVAGRRGIAGRDRVRAAAIEMHPDDIHILGCGRIRHGGVGPDEVIREGFRRHNHRVGKPCGLKVRPQILSNQGIELLRSPKTGIVTGIPVGLILR